MMGLQINDVFSASAPDAGTGVHQRFLFRGASAAGTDGRPTQGFAPAPISIRHFYLLLHPCRRRAPETPTPAFMGRARAARTSATSNVPTMVPLFTVINSTDRRLTQSVPLQRLRSGGDSLGYRTAPGVRVSRAKR